MTQTQMRSVRLGDLQVTLERLDNGKTRVTVSLAKFPGVATEVTDETLLDVAKQLTKFTQERE